MKIPLFPPRWPVRLRWLQWEFSERNIEPMENKDFVLKKGSLTAAKGSETTALKVLRHAQRSKLNVHFCTAALKLNYQLRNRLIKRANNIKKPFETVNKDGFLVKGIAFGKELSVMRDEILKIIPNAEIFLREDRNRIEMSAEDAKKIAKRTKLKIAIVEEYPTAEPWDFELTPLNY